MKGYVMLANSIIAEVFATAMLKFSDGFTLFLPSLGVVAGYGLSFCFLSMCLKTIPLSLAYASWAGIGTALSALIGVLFWGEVFTIVKIVGIIFIVGGVVVLNSGRIAAIEEEPVKEQV